MSGLAVIDSGSFYHHRCLYEAPFDRFYDTFLPLRRLSGTDWDVGKHAAILVPCRTPPELLIPHRESAARYLADGGFIIAMADTGAQHWLPGVAWRDAEVNFWWWKEGTDSGIRTRSPGHALWRAVPPRDAIWHYHGVLDRPEGAVPLLEAEGLGCLLYDDHSTTAGRIIVSTIDPFLHHGCHFMPASTRFLAGFLPWLRTEIRAAAPRASTARHDGR